MPSVRHHKSTTRAVPGAVAVLLALLAVTLGSRPAAADPRPPGPHHHTAASPNGVDPGLHHRIQTVNAQLNRLTRSSDQLDEKYNLAVAAVRSAQRSARQAQHAATQAAARYREAHARFLQAVTQQYEGGPNASLGTLLTSSTPQSYLDSLSLSHYLATDFAGTVRAEQTAHARAGQAAQQAATALSAARAQQVALDRRRAELHAEEHRFQQLLDTLTARQRREQAHARAVAAAQARAQLQPSHPATHPAPGPVGPVSGAVGRVIAFAEAQVGKAYSYGASGPNAYDCSGLTMAAWAQAGVHLPHSAAEQYNYGTHVSYSQLQPGDLIFLYHPIGHVELYVGHDLAVSAADPAQGIVYVHPSQDMADYTGATRLTG